jgi:hypothetical protein
MAWAARAAGSEPFQLSGATRMRKTFPPSTLGEPVREIKRTPIKPYAGRWACYDGRPYVSRISLAITLDGFEELPVVLDEDTVQVSGRGLTAPVNLSRQAMEAGERLGRYLDALDATLQASKFRWHCQLYAENIQPIRIVANLSRLHWRRVDFQATDLTGATVSGAIRLTACRIAPELPEITIEPGEPMVYPPERAAAELGLRHVTEQLVLRWGLARGGNLAQALLWLEPRHPTRPLLERILRRSVTRNFAIGRSARD